MLQPERLRFLGFRVPMPIQATPFRLEPGQRLVLFTDGAVESLPEAEQQDGFGVFAGLVRAGMAPSLELSVGTILARHPAIAAQIPLPDDLTVVLLERAPDV